MINKNKFLLDLMIESEINDFKSNTEEDLTLENNITTNQINLIECPCGAGKTTCVVDYIARNYYNILTDDFDFIISSCTTFFTMCKSF